MRKNEFTSVEQFKSQYNGTWGPSDGHWFGLDFVYNEIEYRFNTGPMYHIKNTILPDGREAQFGIYRKIQSVKDEVEYELLEEFATIDDALESCCICDIPFKSIIVDKDTELVGQD